MILRLRFCHTNLCHKTLQPSLDRHLYIYSLTEQYIWTIKWLFQSHIRIFSMGFSFLENAKRENRYLNSRVSWLSRCTLYYLEKENESSIPICMTVHTFNIPNTRNEAESDVTFKVSRSSLTAFQLYTLLDLRQIRKKKKKDNYMKNRKIYIEN